MTHVHFADIIINEDTYRYGVSDPYYITCYKEKRPVFNPHPTKNEYVLTDLLLLHHKKLSSNYEKIQAIIQQVRDHGLRFSSLLQKGVFEELETSELQSLHQQTRKLMETGKLRLRQIIIFFKPRSPLDVEIGITKNALRLPSHNIFPIPPLITETDKESQTLEIKKRLQHLKVEKDLMKANDQICEYEMKLGMDK